MSGVEWSGIKLSVEEFNYVRLSYVRWSGVEVRWKWKGIVLNRVEGVELGWVRLD